MHFVVKFGHFLPAKALIWGGGGGASLRLPCSLYSSDSCDITAFLFTVSVSGVLDCQFHPMQPWIFSAGADHLIRLYT